MWKEDLSASQLLLFEKIRDEIKEENAKEIDWNDMKGNYNDARDKEAFLKDFQEKWLVKRDRAVAKNQNCELDDVIFKRTQFLLLANYLFDTYDNNKSHLKYYQIIYQRFAELHNIIGEKVLVLPVSTSFFTAHGIFKFFKFCITCSLDLIFGIL
jgi:hypothetical protein